MISPELDLAHLNLNLSLLILLPLSLSLFRQDWGGEFFRSFTRPEGAPPVGDACLLTARTEFPRQARRLGYFAPCVGCGVVH